MIVVLHLYFKKINFSKLKKFHVPPYWILKTEKKRSKMLAIAFSEGHKSKKEHFNWLEVIFS